MTSLRTFGCIRGRDSSKNIVAILIAFITLVPLTRAAEKGGNIFDDDWASPLKPDPDQSNPGTPSTPDVPPSESPARPALPPDPSVAPESKSPDAPATSLPIPNGKDLARSRELMKEVYAAELGDHTVGGRRDFCSKLLTEAAKYDDHPADKFVVLAGAISAAEEAGDLPASFKAADQLAAAFQIDVRLVKANAALKLPVKAYASAENVAAALDVLSQLTAAEDFSTAAHLSSLVQSGVTNDAAQTRLVQSRKKEIDAIRTAREKLMPQLEKLKTAPDDPPANLAAGLYYCFTVEQWDRGLPMLAKGSDAVLSGLAKTELSKPSAADAIARLGDEWWAVALKETGINHAHIDRHAAWLYRRARDGVSGLQQTLIDKRIASVEAAEAGPDARTAIVYNWKSKAQLESWESGDVPKITEDGILITGKIRLRHPVKASTVIVEFTSVGCQAFKIDCRDLRFRVHYPYHYIGAYPIEEGEAAMKKSPCPLQYHKRYVAKIALGKAVSTVKVADATAAIDRKEPVGDALEFAISCDDSSLVIHSIRFEP
ncbi:MAG: hypothetical protein JWL69_2412 [Phycisphaerales bacterium]|nr:hypothetical protein [Phycisphaerales bacterium]